MQDHAKRKSQTANGQGNECGKNEQKRKAGKEKEDNTMSTHLPSRHPSNPSVNALNLRQQKQKQKKERKKENKNKNKNKKTKHKQKKKRKHDEEEQEHVQVSVFDSCMMQCETQFACEFQFDCGRGFEVEGEFHSGRVGGRRHK